MPVQFACQGCQRTLKIGRRKIGTQIECPKCGRKMVVPDLEVATASLAMIRAASATHDEPEIAELVVYDELPEPIAGGSEARGGQPSRGAPSLAGDWRRMAPTRQVASSKGVVLPPPKSSSPALLPAAPLDDRWRYGQRNRSLTGGMLLVSRRVVVLQAVLLLLVGVGGLTVGYLWGRRQVAPPVDDAGAAQTVLLQGTLSHQAEGGLPQGDAGAVVIVLPLHKIPNPKLSAAELHPAGPGPDEGAAVLLALEEMGGRYARADAGGEFSLVVPQPGKYYVLFISKNAQRPSGAPPGAQDMRELGRFFGEPPKLVGKQKYRWAVEDLSGGLVAKSYDFGVSGQP